MTVMADCTCAPTAQVDGLRGFCEAGGSVEGQRRARVLAFYDPYRAQGVQVQHRSE